VFVVLLCVEVIVFMLVHMCIYVMEEVNRPGSAEQI